jgi:hypothetical protein
MPQKATQAGGVHPNQREWSAAEKHHFHGKICGFSLKNPC